MLIKKLDLEELIIVREIAYQTWPITFHDILSKKQIDYMLNWMYHLDSLGDNMNSGHEFYACFEQKTPLGFIGIQAFFPQSDSLKIHKLYVLPDKQGRKIGTKLLETAFFLAQQKGLRHIILNVNRFNKAVSFYQHIGFSIIKEENIDIGNGYLMEDYVMGFTIR